MGAVHVMRSFDDELYVLPLTVVAATSVATRAETASGVAGAVGGVGSVAHETRKVSAKTARERGVDGLTCCLSFCSGYGCISQFSPGVVVLMT